MALDLVPTTELEAVNAMLLEIMEQPVNTLDNLGISEAAIAYDLLKKVSRSVQMKGWNFNSEENYELARDVNGFIALPENALKVSATYSDQNLIMRGNRLYDKINHTFVFTDNVKVDIVLFIAFEEIPEAWRTYITIKAARQLQTRSIGSTEKYKLTELDEEQAQAVAMDEEISSRRQTIFGDPKSAAAVTLYRNPSILTIF